jgi:16S rRNA (cytosine967-C5)-methyltransferase
MQENFDALGRCRAVVADAAVPPFPPGTFDALLLDVPCSNTGVLRRRPDVRWRFSTAQLADLTNIQRGILRAAADLVRRGGRLVYSTCSIEPEENSDQVQRLLREHDEYLLERDAELLPTQMHDGAYAALLRRRRR